MPEIHRAQREALREAVEEVRRTGELGLQVVTGEPGDVWLMHPWMLHAPSANCSERPRMVLTERVRAC